MYVITNKAAFVHSKHDDQDDHKVNTLAFIDFVLVKIFHCQNFMPYSTCYVATSGLHKLLGSALTVDDDDDDKASLQRLS